MKLPSPKFVITVAAIAFATMWLAPKVIAAVKKKTG